MNVTIEPNFNLDNWNSKRLETVKAIIEPMGFQQAYSHLLVSTPWYVHREGNRQLSVYQKKGDDRRIMLITV